MTEQEEPILLRCCPFLGANDDKDLVHGYPTVVNVCHATGSIKRIFLLFPAILPYKAISQEIQEKLCLSKDWTSCPLYVKRLERDSGRTNG